MDRRPRRPRHHQRHPLHLRPHRLPLLHLLPRPHPHLRHRQIQRRRPRRPASLRPDHLRPNRRFRRRLRSLVPGRLGRATGRPACLQPFAPAGPLRGIPRPPRHHDPLRRPRGLPQQPRQHRRHPRVHGRVGVAQRPRPRRANNNGDPLCPAWLPARNGLLVGERAGPALQIQ